ncbi:unnamed protein product [Paramecium pentaurelia]|uniref:Uncharacterized protein n=1 Tax=Paramecium pentaurelia TaxID=43138 RepID=A0A8S1VMJ8_9CILI|nr:unnamed protein product [Paramecium pentaurelia]
MVLVPSKTKYNGIYYQLKYPPYHQQPFNFQIQITNIENSFITIFYTIMFKFSKTRTKVAQNCQNNNLNQIAQQDKKDNNELENQATLLVIPQNLQSNLLILFFYIHLSCIIMDNRQQDQVNFNQFSNILSLD